MKHAKTPYEIRLNLLELAYNIKCDQYRFLLEQNELFKSILSNNSLSDEDKELISKHANNVASAKPPTADDIVAVATLLNEFVSNQKDRD